MRASALDEGSFSSLVVQNVESCNFLSRNLYWLGCLQISAQHLCRRESQRWPSRARRGPKTVWQIGQETRNSVPKAHGKQISAQFHFNAGGSIDALQKLYVSEIRHPPVLGNGNATAPQNHQLVTDNGCWRPATICKFDSSRLERTTRKPARGIIRSPAAHVNKQKYTSMSTRRGGSAPASNRRRLYPRNAILPK
jgi:hypothetical protein